MQYPSGLPQCLGGTFPKKLTIVTGETAQFPKTQSAGDLRDSRLVWAARQKKPPGLMQTKNAKVFKPTWHLNYKVPFLRFHVIKDQEHM
jgi:hypothetical protein